MVTTLSGRRAHALYLTGQHGEERPAGRAGHDPLRGRLRRRHAVDRDAASRARRPRSATTCRRCPTSRPRSARRPARSRASPGFQIHFADHDILTPGDQPDVLVAMNPAALKTNLKDLRSGGTLIVNRDAFSEKNLQKAGYPTNPLEDGSLDDYKVHALPLTSDDGRGAQGHRGRDARARRSGRRTSSRSA